MSIDRPAWVCPQCECEFEGDEIRAHRVDPEPIHRQLRLANAVDEAIASVLATVDLDGIAITQGCDPLEVHWYYLDRMKAVLELA